MGPLWARYGPVMGPFRLLLVPLAPWACFGLAFGPRGPKSGISGVKSVNNGRKAADNGPEQAHRARDGHISRFSAAFGEKRRKRVSLSTFCSVPCPMSLFWGPLGPMSLFWTGITALEGGYSRSFEQKGLQALLLAAWIRKRAWRPLWGLKRPRGLLSGLVAAFAERARGPT